MRKNTIPWDCYAMRKHGLGIRKAILEAHKPFLRVQAARKLATINKELAMDWMLANAKEV